MKFHWPRKSSLALLAISLLALAGIYGVRAVYPPNRAVTSPELDQLRAQRAMLVGATDKAVQDSAATIAELRQHLWTKESFENFRRTIPAVWTTRDLGPIEGKHVPGRRFAFQRPSATDKDWSEILGFLHAIEDARCVNLTSLSLATGAGYAASRKFTQCQVIATFFFTGDDGPK